jgi:YegS/Rv2252/BmrU family lipid kinase
MHDLSGVENKPVPRQAVLVVNAHSRRGEELFRQARDKLEMAGVQLTAAHNVQNRKLLVPTVREAVRLGARMVIVGGGDGSLSSCVDELVGRDCVFAILPLGTANSFARTLGIPLDLDGAIRTIAAGKLIRLDLGLINGDYFANAAAIGISPLIGETVPHKLKRYLGRPGYLLWAIWCLLRFAPFKLHVDDGHQKSSIWASEVRIFNGRFHGGVELLEDEPLDDGEIVLQAVTGRNVWGLMWDWFARFFKLPGRSAMTQDFRGSRLVVDTEPHLKISVDGEVLTRTPAIVESAHKAIDVVVPSETYALRTNRRQTELAR